MNINQLIANELQVKVAQIEATVTLLDEGATVPFIARYRKEITGGLDDTQLRQLEERLVYLRELEERRQTILESIEKQGKLDPELRKLILEADNKSRLEDLYLPYRPKRRTKAQIAKEAGLEPLALNLLSDPNLNPEAEAIKFINPEHGITDTKIALEGACQILMEMFSENADLLNILREQVWQHGLLKSKVAKEKEQEGVKFSDYFAYAEAIKKIPSHRALAVFRGNKEGFLRVSVELASENDEVYYLNLIAKTFNIENHNRPADAWIGMCVELTWKIKLQTKIEADLLLRLREQAESEAIKVFKDNLKNLLMSPPAGHYVTMGLDPGIRTGVKVVVVDDTGKLLTYTAVFPHQPKNDWDGSIEVLSKLCKQYKVKLISIGNGTASRETDKLVAELAARHKDLQLTKVVTSESGASVYSASALAAAEFPNLDVSYRGAVSIARRLQDPLAELVKIDPKAIGVGQYQHDVNQIQLGQGLHAVVEDCVNAVGADVNTASAPLLASIAGLNETTAKNIVDYREKNGRFKVRENLKNVPRLGDKAYEQAVGFLRIIGGDNPLDASAVHPEAYPVVQHILDVTKLPIEKIMGNAEAIAKLNPNDFVAAQFGLPTVKDILTELNKPGRDPRPGFKAAQFKEGVESINDLMPGMILEGVATNVTNFGAFIDIGVHQDGLVHISEMANSFVSDPSKIVKVGDIIKVKIISVDLQRKRIQLSMRLDDKNSSKPKTQKIESSKSKKNNEIVGSLQQALHAILK
jgi:protein Tex